MAHSTTLYEILQGYTYPQNEEELVVNREGWEKLEEYVVSLEDKVKKLEI